MHEVRIKICKLSKNYMYPFPRNLLKEVFFFQIKGINQERKHQDRNTDERNQRLNKWRTTPHSQTGRLNIT